MIKCPICGSTAQVKLTNYFNWECRGSCGITEYYKCGCGCTFNRKYQLYDIEIEKEHKNAEG